MISPQALIRQRKNLGLSQEDVASDLGLPVEAYDHFERGLVAVPEKHASTLKAILQTTLEVLRGQTRYARVSVGDSHAQLDQVYWGEVAIHFDTGTAPILVSVSSADLEEFKEDIEQGAGPLVTLRGMCNEHYIVRREAISEVYMSHDDGDYFGAPGHEYGRFLPLPILDVGHWEVFAKCRDDDDIDFERFCSGEVAVALSFFMSSAQISEILEICEFGRDEDGELTDLDWSNRSVLSIARVAHAGQAAELSDEELAERKEFIMERASGFVVGIKGGEVRRFECDDGVVLNRMFEALHSEPTKRRPMLAFEHEGRTQRVALPYGKIDYVRFASHHLARAVSGMKLER